LPVTQNLQTIGQRRGRKSTLMPPWSPTPPARSPTLPAARPTRPPKRRAPRLLPWLALLLVTLPVANASETVRVGVFGLFHPVELGVQATFGSTLIVEAGPARFTVADAGAIRLRVSGSKIECDIGGTAVNPKKVLLRASGSRSPFRLSVPGKIDRLYQGELEVLPSNRALRAIVVMDVETAVASAVAAESRASASLEALKAQAVASRSFLLASRGRHQEFDLCDTTHCQFLKQPPPADSPAAEAARTTRGLVLRYRNSIVPAMFFAACGGKTFALQDVGMRPGNYPFRSVECPICARKPKRWQRRIARVDAEPLLASGLSELARISLVRKLGWNAVPSNAYSVDSDGDTVSLRGRGAGHGVGLCQRGAAGLAAQGMSFTEILRHYFPDTTLEVAR